MPRRIQRRVKVEDVKERHEAQLMSLEDVVGVALGEKDRKPCLVVYVKKMSPGLAEAIPKEIEGFDVRVEESGEFVALSP